MFMRMCINRHKFLDSGHKKLSESEQSLWVGLKSLRRLGSKNAEWVPIYDALLCLCGQERLAEISFVNRVYLLAIRV